MLQEHLSEPFNVKNFGARRPEFLAEQTAQAQALCYDIHQHTQRYVCMKNLIEDLVKFDDDTQDMLFNLPGITVGLYRHKTFDQTCSDYIAKIFMKLGRSVEVIQQDWRTSFEKQIFLRELRHNIQQKQFMHSMADRFDVMIPYEEIKNQFPPHLINWKNPPHSHTIINYDEYMQTAGFHKKVTHKGINFVIDKTGQHKA